MRLISLLFTFLLVIGCQPILTEPDHASTVAGKYKISQYEFPALGYPYNYKLTYDTTVTLTLKRIDNTGLEARFIYNEDNLDWLPYRNYNGKWLISYTKDDSIDLVDEKMGYTYKNKEISIIAGENGPFIKLKKIDE